MSTFFSFSISDYLRQVDVVDHGQHVAALGVIPSFVEHDIFDSVFRCEIDIMFVGLRVDSRFEVYAA